MPGPREALPQVTHPGAMGGPDFRRLAMSKITKLSFLLAGLVGGFTMFDGCFSAPNVFQWGWPRAVWLWLSEDLITH